MFLETLWFLKQFYDFLVILVIFNTKDLEVILFVQ